MRLASCDDATAGFAEGPGQGGMYINKKPSQALQSRAKRHTKQTSLNITYAGSHLEIWHSGHSHSALPRASKSS